MEKLKSENEKTRYFRGTIKRGFRGKPALKNVFKRKKSVPYQSLRTHLRKDSKFCFVKFFFHTRNNLTFISQGFILN